MFDKIKKGASDGGMPATVEQASIGSPGYPKDFSVGALRERRLLMSLRVVSISLFAALVVCVVQAFLLVSIFPLKEVRPFLVELTDAGSVAHSIKPIEDTFEAKDLLTEKLVREYIVNRSEILRSEEVMADRWGRGGYIGVTTDADEYNRFVDSVSPTLDLIRGQGAERRVSIVAVNTVKLGSLYIADYTAKSYDQRQKLVDEKTYTATVDIEFRPLRDMTKDQMLINPTGFTVVNFSLAEKDQ
ncbi:VirB8/TrbF family protein [Loktanella sp. DJP18]|uniref:VirB8/TrbF family protein n=1 Tax=Loktanella sp. DJP18 TaxID=3409788 RepID=UPI003BB7279E